MNGFVFQLTILVTVPIIFVAPNYFSNLDASIDVLEGDIVPPRQGHDQVQNAAIRLSSHRWPDNEIPYEFSSSYPSYLRGAVRAGMAVIERKTCIKFVERLFQSDYVEIINGDGCYSYVGRIGGKQVLSLPRDCHDDGDTILHELMHAIGFFHEHSRYDRDDHVTVDLSNVPRHLRKQFEKFDQSIITHQNTRYDYKSVLHYPARMFNSVVFRPKEYGAVIGSNGLSETDVYEINTLYDCTTPDTGSNDDQLPPPDTGSNDDQLPPPDTGSNDDQLPPPDNNDNDERPRTFEKCSSGTFYCGSELKQKNYKNVLSDSYLYKCDSDYDGLFQAECGNCIVSTQSYCACKPGYLYCGYELLRMNFVFHGLQNHGLYYCHNHSYVAYSMRCDNKCKQSSTDSSCRDSYPEKCLANHEYCGYELISLAYDVPAADLHRLYHCTENGQASSGLMCFSGCKVATDSTCDLGKYAQKNV